MDRRIWTAWVGSAACALVLGSCAAEPDEEAISSQEWDLKHGGVDRDGCPSGAHRIVGTAGDDVIWGTRKADCILGLGGNDTIHGLAGDDVLIGGDGDDLLIGDDDDDKMSGGAGADTMYGGNGLDLLMGGQGNDVLDGGNGSDWLAGGDCNDHLIGSRGADVLLGEGGNDRIEPGHFELVDGGKGVDACKGFHCEVRPEAPACTSDADCHAPKHCVQSTGVCAADSTDDVCGGGGNEDCQDDDCSDDNACNGDESCDAGGMCVGGTAPSVDDSNACTADSCAPATGVSHTPTAAGSSCSDGNACNGAETCDGAGSCGAGTAPTIDDHNPCTTDACSPSTGVSHTPLSAGSACSDGNACNGAETCDGAGACNSGTPPMTDDGNPCTADACNPATGVTHVPTAMGSACGDGDVCNGVEGCDGAGSCVGGMAPSVDDANPCTADSCDAMSGVMHVALPMGTACGDTDVCNGDELCDAAGACVAGTALDADDGNACTADSCDPVTGVSNVAEPVGTSCTDGDACNGDEICDGGGACNPGTAPATDDGNVCTADFCSPASGVSHSPLPSGTSCGDGNACNGGETCNGAGTCASGTPPAVNDGNPCTTDACSPGTGVSHTALPTGTACGGGMVCNASATCAPGPCFGRPMGFSCSDGNPCNGAELCSGTGVCLPGTPPPRPPLGC